MMGIKVDELESLIKKNNIYVNSYNSNAKRLLNSINDLKNCYDGNDLGYLFKEPMNQMNNVDTILSIFESYSETLNNVKISYQQQDLNLKLQTDRVSSNL